MQKMRLPDKICQPMEVKLEELRAESTSLESVQSKIQVSASTFAITVFDNFTFEF